MGAFPYDREQLAKLAQFSNQVLGVIKQRRQEHKQFGFGYQLAFVRLLRRFPIQRPFYFGLDSSSLKVLHELDNGMFYLAAICPFLPFAKFQ